MRTTRFKKNRLDKHSTIFAHHYWAVFILFICRVTTGQQLSFTSINIVYHMVGLHRVIAYSNANSYSIY